METAGELRRKLEASMKSGKPLRTKYGIDPTGFDAIAAQVRQALGVPAPAGAA